MGPVAAGQAAKPTALELGLCTGTVRADLCCGAAESDHSRVYGTLGALSMAEREEISRGLACGRSIGALARC